MINHGFYDIIELTNDEDEGQFELNLNETQLFSNT
jgi:hypothetical protein